MILGCPAIMAPCGALPEVGGEAAVFASQHDPREWVSAIGKFAGDMAVWEKYSRAGRERAGLFTWERAGNKLMKVIKAVVSAKRMSAVEP
jgi:glycosyltransferase involved in cell wall biosynthesis